MKSEKKEKIVTKTPNYWKGSGTSNDPYQIGSFQDLNSLWYYVNSGNTAKNMYFIITNNIEIPVGTNTCPIGGWDAAGKPNYKYFFSGKIDGNGKTISNLKILSDVGNEKNLRVGWFGYIKGEEGNYAEIKNLQLKNFNISGNGNIGGLCGEMTYCNIENVSIVGGKITGSLVVGGLFGQGSFSTVRNSYADIHVEGGDYLGGFCGSNGAKGKISNCYTFGEGRGFQCVGGFCGDNGGSIYNSYVVGTGKSILSNNTCGGFCGLNKGALIDNCFVGDISIQGGAGIGGFCGENNTAKISNSYTFAKVNYYYQKAGGFCGINTMVTAEISNCYAAGSIDGDDELIFVGSFLGHESDIAIVKNCYCLENMTKHKGHAKSKTEAEMKEPGFVDELNDDQSPISWMVDKPGDAAINNGFPILDMNKPN